MTVRKGDRYVNFYGVTVQAARDGLVVEGKLVSAEEMVAALNQLGGYGKIKRRHEVPNANQPQTP